jgi:hypothetical protein
MPPPDRNHSSSVTTQLNRGTVAKSRRTTLWRKRLSELHSALNVLRTISPASALILVFAKLHSLTNGVYREFIRRMARVAPAVNTKIVRAAPRRTLQAGINCVKPAASLRFFIDASTAVGLPRTKEQMSSSFQIYSVSLLQERLSVA